MTLQELGSVGEFLGAIAVLVTLAYLAVQTRQNSKMLQMNSFALMNEPTWTAYNQIAQNSEIADIMRRGWDNPEALNETEFHRFNNINNSIMWGLLYTNYFHQEGMIPDEVWQSVMEDSAHWYASVGFRSELGRRSSPLAQRFRNTLESKFEMDFPSTR